VASILLIVIAHPTLLLTVASADVREDILGIVRQLPALDDIYEHWGITRQAWWIVLLQVLLSLGAACLVKKRGSAPRGLGIAQRC
jgi:hypothetical protein